MNIYYRNLLLRILTVLFAAAGVFFIMPSVCSADAGLITTVSELNEAIMNASDGDTILVGNIEFKPMPKGMFMISKNITLKSGLKSNAVFTNATFAINGTVSSDALSVTFENIDFRGDNSGISEDSGKTPEVSTELPGIMNTMCAGIFSKNSDVTYNNCTFTGYHNGYGGVFSAIYSSDNSMCNLRLSLNGCSFFNNYAKCGGCLYLSGSGQNIKLSARRCVFDNNKASSGGALWAESSEIDLTDCIFRDNKYLEDPSDFKDGGALSLYRCVSHIDGCLFADNNSAGRGGCIVTCISPFETLAMRNCTVIGNKGENDEGIYIYNADSKYDTDPVAYINFSSLFGKQIIEENAKLFGCILSDGGSEYEPSDENGYCLKILPDNAVKYGLITDSSSHITLPSGTYPVPLDAIPEHAGSVYRNSLGLYQTGDNYASETVINLKISSGHSDNIILHYGDVFEPVEPTRLGYSFVGWKFNKSRDSVNSGSRFIGGSLPGNTICADWHMNISEKLHIIIPVTVLGIIIIVLFVFLIFRKTRNVSGSAAPVPQSDESVILSDDWIERTVNKPEITENLSKREIEVLRKLLEGKSRKQAAEDLFVTEATIKKHSTSIYSKLDVHNRTELVYKLNKQ